MKKPTSIKYFFSVEGETEQWYLQWLQKTINLDSKARYRAKFDIKIQKNPLKRAKGLNIISKTEVIHVFDYESDEPAHVQHFLQTLDRMEEAQDLKKDITYTIGYTNFTFELWMILHKNDCNGPLSHRKQYLSHINKAFNEKFNNLDEYKKEDSFNRVLEKITLDDVRQAIIRSNLIMQNNERVGHNLQNYKNYEYYKENPSLSIWESIEKILSECMP